MSKRTAASRSYRETVWYRWPLVWLLTANIALLVGCLAQWGVFEAAELKTYDWRLHQRGIEAQRSHIIVISIDAPSVNMMAHDEQHILFPQDRINHKSRDFRYIPEIFWGSYHAKVLQILTNAGAKAIGLDVVLPAELTAYYEEKSGALPPENPEQQMAQAIGESTNMVMLRKRDLMPDGSAKDILSSHLLTTALALSGGQMGFDKTTPDADGVLRRFTAIGDSKDEFSFPLVLASIVAAKVPQFKKGELRLGDRLIPLDADDQGLISYLGPDGTFPRISYQDLLTNPEKYSKELKDSVCLIGYTSYESQDFHSVPFANSFQIGQQQNFMAGVEVHANVLHTLLYGPFIAQLDSVGVWAIIALAAIVAIPLAWLPRIIFLVPMLFGSLFCWVGFCLLAFMDWDLDLPLVAIALTLTLSQISNTAMRLWQENQGKRWIEDVMGQRVSPEVLDYLRHSPDALTPGGRRQEVTVLFSDIRNFTQLSESMSPEQVTGFLNNYLDEMVEIILAHGGMVDKFIGDGIMVIYNWPIAHPDHALRAVNTAVAMQAGVAASQQRWIRMGMPHIEIGVGIHTGPAVLGTIGSTRKNEQTAIGDTVNVASRIEGLCKTLGKSLNSGILFSETTYVAAKKMQLEEGKFPFEIVPAAETEVRGRREALQLFAICLPSESHET